MVEVIPITKDASGVYRIAGTRVTLDLVIQAFNRGATPEEIAQDYPAVALADVYQVIGYYLKHGSEFEEYLADRTLGQGEGSAQLAEWSPVGLRSRLLARRKHP
jgi:uncharacterized protein (DUF433 family)